MPGPSPLDIVSPDKSYTAGQALTGFATFHHYLKPEHMTPAGELPPKYLHVKQDDPNQPMMLSVWTAGTKTSLPEGTEFTVREIHYHAAATLRKGVTKEGAYQCAWLEVTGGGPPGKYFVWTVFNGKAKKLQPAGWKTLIVAGQPLACTVTLETADFGLVQIAETVCPDPTIPAQLGSATVYVRDPAQLDLEDILVVIQDESGQRWRAVTDGDGRVDFHNLPPGNYQITTAFDGWKACP